MNWALEEGKFQIFDSTKKYYPSLRELLDLIEGDEGFSSSGKVFPSLIKSFSHIDFEASMLVSGIKARIYFPSDNSKLRPVLQFLAIDPYYQEHQLSELPKEYLVVDGLFLVFDLKQIEILENVFQGYCPGVLPYKKLSELFSEHPLEVELINDDSKCVIAEQTSIENTSTGFVLYPYQQTGVTWLNSVISEGTGCVLADEMGLGKTLQIIVILSLQIGKGPSLVIAPNSLVENWIREFRKFAPEISVSKHAGKYRDLYWPHFLNYDVVVTSYDTALSDFSIMMQNHWNLIVLDEAQAIKNDSKRSRHIREFHKNSGIAVTGTPFENHVTDIWSIFDFCFRGLLGARAEFSAFFKDNTDSAEKLERIISPLLLRRRVSTVKQDLPQKVIVPYALEMYPNEAEGYERLRKESSSDSKKGTLQFGILTKLREYCALPSIIDDSLKVEEPEKVSAKFGFLIDLLDEIYCLKEKVILFTEWREAQCEISKLATNRYNVFNRILNGDVPVSDRLGIIDEFSKKDGFAVLILNPTVGGTGLNITAANHVIFYSLSWNPALEDQCIARAMRIGQEKIVRVYRLFYTKTVEDVMNDRLEQKRMIAGIVVHGTEGEDPADIQRALLISPFIGGGND